MNKRRITMSEEQMVEYDDMCEKAIEVQQILAVEAEDYPLEDGSY
jgi:hypothetical protein